MKKAGKQRCSLCKFFRKTTEDEKTFRCKWFGKILKKDYKKGPYAKGCTQFKKYPKCIKTWLKKLAPTEKGEVENG